MSGGAKVCALLEGAGNIVLYLEFFNVLVDEGGSPDYLTLEDIFFFVGTVPEQTVVSI